MLAFTNLSIITCFGHGVQNNTNGLWDSAKRCGF